MKDKKLWWIAGFLLLNTCIIFTVLQVKEMSKDPVVYETFSEEAAEGTYKIETVQDYLDFAETVNQGNSYKKCEIVLLNDLDFSGISDVPVIGLADGQMTTFSGIFNGNGHEIEGLRIINSSGIAAMFADLDGMILNLTLDDCYFEGEKSAALCGELKSGGVLLNCQADAECVGTISGTLTTMCRGYIYHCVAEDETVIYDRRGGYIEQCYLKKDGNYLSFMDESVVLSAKEAADEMNRYLPRSGAFHGRDDILRWSGEEELELTDQKAVLIDEITVKIQVQRQETVLKGYYSHLTDHWCVALPKGYFESQMKVTVKNTDGKTESFTRSPGESTILYTDGEYQHFIDFLAIEDADTIYINLNGNKTLTDLYANKETEYPAMITKIDADGNVQTEQLKAVYGHGNDSWDAEKKSFNLKFENETDFFDLGADEAFVLLAGYRDNSLMHYVSTTTMIHALDFPYALDFDLINVYIDGEYLGVYFLVEKLELDENRINISSVYAEMKETLGDKLETYTFRSWKDTDSLAERYYYEVDQNPEDLSGGYLLELDVSDYDEDASRFVSSHGNRMTMKRAQYSSKEQVDYIADYWQGFEDALYSETGYNDAGKYYADYIDLKSFAKQWLLYELVQENSMSSSVYFYKESEVSGDGLLHACFPWDMEHSYLMYGPINDMWLRDSTTSNSFWSRFWIHEDFRAEVRRLWEEEFIDVINRMIADEAIDYGDGIKNISWYQEAIDNISDMERSRWWKMDPSQKCEDMKEFLSIRKNTLSVLLYEEPTAETVFTGE